MPERAFKETNASPEFAKRTRGIRAQRDCVGAANFRVCGTKYCPARAAARGSLLKPLVLSGNKRFAFENYGFVLPCAGGGTGRHLRPKAPRAGHLGHYICAPITTEAAPTVKLHSSPLFSGTCRRTASVKGTGLEQIQRELNTLQPKLGNSRPREFPHALINAHYTGAFSFSGIVQQPRTHGGSYSLLKHEQVQQIFANENPRGRTSPR